MKGIVMIRTISLPILAIVCLSTFLVTAHLNNDTFRKRYGVNSALINVPLYFQKAPNKRQMDRDKKQPQEKKSKEKDKQKKLRKI